MKRLTLLTILLVVVGLTAGFAVDVKPVVAIGGDATLSWGIDLDNMDTGFSNSYSVNFDVTFIASASDTHQGKDAVYGAISLTSFAFTGDNATPAITLPGVTAWIMAGPAKIGVYSAPDFAIDKVAAIEASTTDAVLDDESATDVAPDYAGYGTYVAYPVGPITLTVRVLSATDWNTAPADNAYAFGLGAAGTVGPATIGLDAFYGLDTSALGIGASASAAFGPVGVAAGFDGQYDGTFAWEVGGGVSATLMEGVTAGVKAVYGDAFDLDVQATFAEAAAKGLVDNLAFSVTGYVLDILTALEYEVVVAGSYAIGNITPSFSVTYGDPSEVGEDTVLTATVTLTVNPIFPLTTFTLTYTSGNFLAATPVIGDIVAALKVTY